MRTSVVDTVAEFWNLTAWDGACRVWRGYVLKKPRSNRWREPVHPGYVRFGGVLYPARRLAWEFTFKTAVPEGFFVVQKSTCTNPRCVHPDHLRLGRRTELGRERFRFGYTCPRGEKAPRAKLTRWRVLSIVALLDARKLPLRLIAARYRVAISSVSAINTGRSWAHLTGRVHRPNAPRRYVLVRS